MVSLDDVAYHAFEREHLPTLSNLLEAIMPVKSQTSAQKDDTLEMLHWRRSSYESIRRPYLDSTRTLNRHVSVD